MTAESIRTILGFAGVMSLYGSAGWFIWSGRRWSRKATTKRRLLVKDENGLPMWRTVNARVLVGWVGSKGVVSTTLDRWAVLETRKGKLVVYRDDERQPEGPRTGVIQVCDSWRELESVVPPRVFEQALLEAGIKKPSEYRAAPLEL